MARENPVTLFAFDVLRLYGVDLTRRPWSERRETLERIESPLLQGDFPGWRLSPVYDDGSALLTATEAQGLEGVVAKRRSGTYQPGRRSPDWIKFAHRASVTCLVGGWRPESSGANRIGALLVGVRVGDDLRFLGRVGSGMTSRLEADLRARLLPLATDSSPFADEIPRVDAGAAHWCRPEVSVEVSYLGHALPAEGSRLRAPVLRGLRAAVDLDDDPTDDVADDATDDPPGDA
jgi:bifunctional non-homologous end joining protein LigD